MWVTSSHLFVLEGALPTPLGGIGLIILIMALLLPSFRMCFLESAFGCLFSQITAIVHIPDSTWVDGLVTAYTARLMCVTRALLGVVAQKSMKRTSTTIPLIHDKLQLATALLRCKA